MRALEVLAWSLAFILAVIVYVASAVMAWPIKWTGRGLAWLMDRAVATMSRACDVLDGERLRTPEPPKPEPICPVNATYNRLLLERVSNDLLIQPFGYEFRKPLWLWRILSRFGFSPLICTLKLPQREGKTMVFGRYSDLESREVNLNESSGTPVLWRGFDYGVGQGPPPERDN